MPIRLVAGESVDGYTDPGFEATPDFRNVMQAFAETATNECFSSESSALRRVVREGLIPPLTRGTSPLGGTGVLSVKRFGALGFWQGHQQ